MDIPVVFQCSCGGTEFAIAEVYVNDETAVIKVRGVCLGCQKIFESIFNPKEIIELYRTGGETNLKKQNLN